MKSSLIHEPINDGKKMKRASSFSGKNNKKRKSRSKSKSRIIEEIKKVEVILEVDQEYKEKSSNWSQNSLQNKDDELIKEIVEKTGLDYDEIKSQNSKIKNSDRSSITNT